MHAFPKENGLIISRRIPPHIRKAAAKHASHGGFVVWAANWLQGGFFQVFQVLLRDIHPEIARAIWHSHKSDNGQREMVADVARETLVDPHPLLLGIVWAVQQAGTLSGYRNDFVHTPMTYSEGVFGKLMIPHPAEAAERRIKRMDTMWIKRAAPQLWGDLYVLGAYVRALADWLNRPNQLAEPPLPCRPPLRTTELLADDARKNHRPHPSVRQRRPRPSRA